ncbi:NAD(P)-dependent alcohol dehydrogenase [Cytophagaceae bacterium ABcell3]|nr:NAD(P)-dependent alcohol dehydrogenase [Cytophagaceae bacterium ABcell3]
MKAAVLKSYGKHDVFEIKETSAPSISKGQVLVRNYASSVNPVDLQVRRGNLRFASGLFGASIIGSDFSGKVIESKSSHFKEGDDVFGFVTATKGHAYGELIAVDEKNAVLKPKNLSYKEAATLPLVASTSWQALLKLGKLASGQHVLINGCTGGVGFTAVQIAKSIGATVTGVCGNKHLDDAKKLGCDDVLDYQNDKLPQDHRFDLIFDTAGKLSLSDVEPSLKPEGQLVVTIPVMKNLATMLRSSFELVKKRMKLVVVFPETETLENIKKLIEHEKLRPYIAKSFDIKDISSAHKMLEDESFVGKIALEI